MSVCCLCASPVLPSSLGIPFWNSPVSQVSEVLAELHGTPESLTNLLMYLGSYSVRPFSSISSPLPSLRLAFLPPLQPHPHSLCLLYCTGTYKPASTQAVVVCASLHSFVTTFDSSPTVLLLCTFFSTLLFFYYCFFRVRLEDNQTNLSFILLLLDNFDSSIRGHKKIIRFKKKQEARSKSKSWEIRRLTTPSSTNNWCLIDLALGSILL